MKMARTDGILRMRGGAWRALGVAGLLLCTNAALGQDWAKAMFDHTTHDFGVVARGAKVEHRFVVENIYEEDAHIKSVSSSCGCSKPQISKPLLKTWEKAEILVTLDTRDFLGRKDATITVVLDLPFPAEVQLHIHAYIRSDIVIQPGSAEFGAVNQGSAAARRLTISYAGRDDWRIERVECANPHIVATLGEVQRTPGLVSYELSVKLQENAPPGYFRDQLTLVTNDFDGKAARVPVMVDGTVSPALVVRPSPLSLGTVVSGGAVTRNLVIQGRAPFRVIAVRCIDDRFAARVPTDAKTVQIVPVTFSAKGEAGNGGKATSKIQIETDLSGGMTAEVEAVVEVVAEGRSATPLGDVRSGAE